MASIEETILTNSIIHRYLNHQLPQEQQPQQQPEVLFMYQ